MQVLTHPSPALVSNTMLLDRLVTAGINFPRGLGLRESDILTGGDYLIKLMRGGRKINDYRTALAAAAFNQAAKHIFVPNKGIQWLGAPYQDVYKDAINMLRQLYRADRLSEYQTELLGSVIHSMQNESLLFAENVGFITYLILSNYLLDDMLAIAERKVRIQIKYAS